jgi:anion-transporting  ArsA/GET3 family ATPase
MAAETLEHETGELEHLFALLVSMDPALNQRDLFETEFSERPKQVIEALSVKEVDADLWIGRYLRETRKQIQRTYIYESAFNLQKHLKVIQFSPGLEAYALLQAFENVLRSGHSLDAIIFDRAPTALTLRFFLLPAFSRCQSQEHLQPQPFGHGRPTRNFHGNAQDAFRRCHAVPPKSHHGSLHRLCSGAAQRYR